MWLRHEEYEIFLKGNYDYYNTICVLRNYDYTTRIQMSNESQKSDYRLLKFFYIGHLHSSY